MDVIELRVNRKNTEHFINEDPSTFVVTRGGEKVPDGAGGWTVPPGDPVGNLTGRLVPAGGRIQSRNIDGEEIQPSYVLITTWDADVKMSDVLVKSDRNYEVLFVREDRDYETWVELIYRG